MENYTQYSREKNLHSRNIFSLSKLKFCYTFNLVRPFGIYKSIFNNYILLHVRLNNVIGTRLFKMYKI